MNIFNWITNLFTDTTPSSIADHDFSVNPANGLLMIGRSVGVDIEGNTFGTDFSHDCLSSACFDDSFSSGLSSEDNWNSSSDIFSD
jgi:hypothetical protein